MGDEKLAKSIISACKNYDKKGTKRGAEDSAKSPDDKKPKLSPHKHDLDYSSISPADLESSLSLPLITDENVIRSTKVVTNRAPLVLAFAVELLRVTMPEQPPSSRLSLGQALVSANSRSKAISIGIEKGPAAGEQVMEGQPNIRIMSREIPVLKRGDYEWIDNSQSSTTSAATLQPSGADTAGKSETWSGSKKLTSNKSTFIAHVASSSSTSSRGDLIKMLMAQKPELETASHNAWAMRTQYGASPLVQEASFDDGEQGCGKFMLQLMREAGVTNIVVLLTRWYGGVMLGPDRWRLMRECIHDAISSQRRVTQLSGGALWGLDMQNDKPAISTLGMAIHRPEGARNYLLRSFASPVDSEMDKKKSVAVMKDEKQENLGSLLGALRSLFESWSETLGRAELDSRAWGWYIKVRPDVDAGPSGWGAKGTLDLGSILDLRRKANN